MDHNNASIVLSKDRRAFSLQVNSLGTFLPKRQNCYSSHQAKAHLSFSLWERHLQQLLCLLIKEFKVVGFLFDIIRA